MNHVIEKNSGMECGKSVDEEKRKIDAWETKRNCAH